MVPAIVALAVIPFGDKFFPAQFYYDWMPWLKNIMMYIFGNPVDGYTMQVANMDVGLLFVFAVTGLGIYGAILGGWSSNNKFSLLGAMRGCAQMISYEIFLGVSILGILFIYGTFDISEIVNKQNELAFGVIPKWGIVLQPLAFILFYVAQMAENKRVPFDMPEAESELILGYQTEYNGFRAGTFIFAELMESVTVASIMVALFLGGYHLPYLQNHGFVFPGGTEIALSHPTVVILRLIAFSSKVVVLLWFQQLMRWTMPRFRYDQVMNLGWKALLPLSLANVIITVIVVSIIDALSKSN
jgi:NADH-quinone oxidoreductase subunit H